MSLVEARRQRIRAGHGITLSAATASPGAVTGATPEQEIAHLRAIANYIGDTDRLMVGAAFLLEQSGFERSQLQLELPSPTSDERS